MGWFKSRRKKEVQEQETKLKNMGLDPRTEVFRILLREGISIFSQIVKTAKEVNMPVDQGLVEYCCNNQSGTMKKVVLLLQEVWETEEGDTLLPVMRKAQNWIGVKEEITGVMYLPGSVVNDLLQIDAIYSLEEIGRMEQRLEKVEQIKLSKELADKVNYFLAKQRTIADEALRTIKMK